MARLRVFSYSDHIRYYWSDEVVSQALGQLLKNLQDMSLPETLVSQAFMGLEFGEIRRPQITFYKSHKPVRQPLFCGIRLSLLVCITIYLKSLS